VASEFDAGLKAAAPQVRVLKQDNLDLDSQDGVKH
jgi:hypothetical protein